MGLDRVIAVANGKGGVGKTSVVANLAGEFAAANLSVLVVDLDVSGNLKLDFGLVGHEGDDQGRGIYDAILRGDGLPIIEAVRENIDWIPGGQALNWLMPIKLGGDDMLDGGVDSRWRGLLSDAADDYDVVLVDCPPGTRQLQEMALAAARWVLVPSKSDPASWDGLQMLGPLVKQAREQINPELDWMGMVLFAHQTTATRVLRNTKARMADSRVPMLASTIRASESTAQECRHRGLLVRELAAKAPTRSETLAALRARRLDPNVAMPQAVSQTSSSLAEDYAALAAEVANLMIQTEQPA